MSIFKRDCECEDCILGWEDLDYEGDCNDCGCMFYDDLCGNKFVCRMPDFVKSLIYKYKEHNRNRAEARQYEGMIEWYEERERKSEAMLQAITEKVFINHYGEELFLCSRDQNGKLWLYNGGKPEVTQVDDVVLRYNELLKEE